MAKKNKEPRQNSLITLQDWYQKELEDRKDMTFDQERLFGTRPWLVYLGEIPNMRGHCIVMGRKTGKMYIGYHIEDFRELTEEET